MLNIAIIAASAVILTWLERRGCYGKRTQGNLGVRGTHDHWHGN